MATPHPSIGRRGVLWSAALDRPTPNRATARVSAAFKSVQTADVARLLAAVAQIDPIPPEALRRRFESGRQCYAAWVEESIAAYGWLTRGREWVGEFERELNVEEGEAYLWDCATLPAYRRQRLFSALIGNVAEQLSETGVRRLWIIAVISAPAMNRGLIAAGFEPILGLTYLHLRHKQLLLTRPKPRASPQQISAARRLLTGDHNRRLGPLIVSNTAHLRPPDTHIGR